MKRWERLPPEQEMMDDCIDDAFEADDEEAQVDEVVGQVLAEIGIDINDQVLRCRGWR